MAAPSVITALTEVNMQAAQSFVPYFVRVDCDAHSRHRSPQGVYRVEVEATQTTIERACSAIQTIKDRVAFMCENTNRAIVRVFTIDGDEVCIPRYIEPENYDSGEYLGRAVEYPESITIQ